MATLPFNLLSIKKLIIPSVCILIAFLAYSSQWLFYYLEPGPLTQKETIWFNILVGCIWVSYERACRVDPGSLPERFRDGRIGEEAETPKDVVGPQSSRSWCKKCNAIKPPRAHHCSQCNRCVPKMDHHCPWTSNCVSYTTFPHFLRFVLFAVVSMSLLEYHLYIRASFIWSSRNLPSYLGPSVISFAHLFVLLGTNSLVLFVLLILLVSAIHSLAINTTMIETWEIERHETLVKKARYQGGYVYAPGGRRIRMKRQEFPYDIGIWKNLVQGMGSANVLAWFLPFDDDLDNEDGWEFEINGFEDPDVVWPPLDPDKMGRDFAPSRDMAEERGGKGDSDEVAAFKRRQRDDYRRRGIGIDQEMRESRVDKKNYDWLEEDEDDREEDWSESEENPRSSEWVNCEGHRMRDYGVDEEAEVLIDADDEDLPLGELVRRRKAREQSSG